MGSGHVNPLVRGVACLLFVSRPQHAHAIRTRVQRIHARTHAKAPRRRIASALSRVRACDALRLAIQHHGMRVRATARPLCLWRGTTITPALARMILWSNAVMRPTYGRELFPLRTTASPFHHFSLQMGPMPIAREVSSVSGKPH